MIKTAQSQRHPVSDLAKSNRASRLVKVNRQIPSTPANSDPTTKTTYRKRVGDNEVNYSESWEFLKTYLYYLLENAVSSQNKFLGTVKYKMKFSTKTVWANVLRLCENIQPTINEVNNSNISELISQQITSKFNNNNEQE